jgi:hypothetical protein
MKWNIPIITFVQRTWMLFVFTIASNYAVLSNHQFFRHWTVDAQGKTVYIGQTIFETFGAVAYVPGLVSAVLFVSLFCIHLFYRQTIDADAHDETYLKDWRNLTASQRVLYSTIVRIGFIIGFCILCSGLARGGALKDNSFESYEFDLWMYQVCCIAPQLQFQIRDCDDESLQEWFWNYYFLEGKTPIEAITGTQEYDRAHKTKHG